MNLIAKLLMMGFIRALSLSPPKVGILDGNVFLSSIQKMRVFFRMGDVHKEFLVVGGGGNMKVTRTGEGDCENGLDNMTPFLTPPTFPTLHYLNHRTSSIVQTIYPHRPFTIVADRDELFV